MKFETKVDLPRPKSNIRRRRAPRRWHYGWLLLLLTMTGALFVAGIPRAVRVSKAQESSDSATSPASCPGGLRPRVLILVDSSGSMTEHFADNLTTGGDGSSSFIDSAMDRSVNTTPGFVLYQGFQTGSPQCPPFGATQYDGINSRLYATKAAVRHRVSQTAGIIDWGLMRYSGTSCPFGGFSPRVPHQACATDNNCNAEEFCVGGACGLDTNLCFSATDYGATDQRGGTPCRNHLSLDLTYGGDCGVLNPAGSPACATLQVCYSDADCSGAQAGQCALIGSGPARSCLGGGGFPSCPVGYISSAGRCVYNVACQNPGGAILADPSQTNSDQQLQSYLDGVEDYRDNGSGQPINRELRAVGPTPLAGAARSATAWYNNIKFNSLDPQILCRPYILVLITDGADTCETDPTNGTVAAAGSFVAATAQGAANPNKVYVIALATSSDSTLNAIAHAGGTGQAFFANNQAEIEAALSQIVQLTPTAADANVSGQILDTSGNPVEGVAIRMSGTQSRVTVTDANGNYRFDNVDTNGFYTVMPSRPNFNFSPSQRSFSALGQHTDAAFNATWADGSLNPLDTTEYFVRQQYVDFLGREPDEAGLNFWVNNIELCGSDQNCRLLKRVDTSAAFFLSIEFQQTGYLVYRTYKAAYGNLPNGAPVPIRLDEFTPNTQEIGNGVIVNQSGWETVLENNKRAFVAEFVQRSRFASAYPSTMSPTEFVDRLFANAAVTMPADSDRTAAINEFGSANTSADAAARARALRRVAENATLGQQEFNRAFALMQYFGYLRRNPNDAPEAGLNFDGYNFWLTKLNTFNGNFQNAEMVKAFLVSGEYRQRFPR